MAIMLNNEIIKIILEDRKYPMGIFDFTDFMPRYLRDKFLEYLSPDSESFLIPFNPIFSLELEYTSLDRISQVNVFWLKDGVLPLLRFFIFHPTPYAPGPKLIIDEQLSPLVPLAWREHVVLKKLIEIPNESELVIRNKLLVFVSIQKESFDSNLLFERIEKLKNISKEFKEVQILFSTGGLRGEGNAINNENLELKILNRINQAGVFCEVLNYKEFLAKDLAEFQFINLFNHQYYVSDSKLNYLAYQKGANNFEYKVEDLSYELYRFNVSKNHGYCLHQNFKQYNDFNISKLKSHILELGARSNERSNKMAEVIFASKEFKSLALDIALKLKVN